MGGDFKFRRASLDDLEAIVTLILQDALAQEREAPLDNGILDQRYREAFHKIDADENQYLMVVDYAKEVIGTCHLTLIPSLTFKGSTRLQIEAVRVSQKHRGKKIGAKMMEFALDYAKKKGASIVQLTTNKERPEAIKFYEKQGFKVTHEGMKLYL
ncbi:MAG TPA: GNAT family N-acetyltransferase [Holosporales bacterium]|nr:GNAT family N-acetyltransferase [Holosporales bacterium]